MHACEIAPTVRGLFSRQDGKGQSLGRAARQCERSTSSNTQESMTKRSLPPLPYSIRISPRLESMSRTLIATASEIRRPTPQQRIRAARYFRLGTFAKKVSVSSGLRTTGSELPVRIRGKHCLPHGTSRVQIKELHGGRERADALRREFPLIHQMGLILPDCFKIQLFRAGVEDFANSEKDVTSLCGGCEATQQHVPDKRSILRRGPFT